MNFNEAPDETLELVRTADARAKSTGCAQHIVDRAGQLLAVQDGWLQQSDIVLETFRP